MSSLLFYFALVVVHTYNISEKLKRDAFIILMIKLRLKQASFPKNQHQFHIQRLPVMLSLIDDIKMGLLKHKKLSVDEYFPSC